MSAITAWFASIKRFLSSTYRELQRIQWPNRAQTVRLTMVVIISSLVIGIYLFVIDYALLEGLKSLLQQ